jgi:hypothetical protein
MKGLLLLFKLVDILLSREHVIARRGTLGWAAPEGVGAAPSPVLQVELALAGGSGLLYLFCSETVKETFISRVRVLPVLWLLRVEQQVMTCLLLLCVHVILE